MIIKNIVGRQVTKPTLLACGTANESMMTRRRKSRFDLEVGETIKAHGIKMTVTSISRYVYTAEYVISGKTIRESFRIDDYGRAYDEAKVKAVRRED